MLTLPTVNLQAYKRTRNRQTSKTIIQLKEIYFGSAKKKKKKTETKKNNNNSKKTGKQTQKNKTKNKNKSKQNRNSSKQTNFGYWMGIALLHNYPQINNRSMILPNTAVISCSDDVLPCVVTNFVPVELVLVRTGWPKQIPWLVAVQKT